MIRGGVGGPENLLARCSSVLYTKQSSANQARYLEEQIRQDSCEGKQEPHKMI